MNREQVKIALAGNPNSGKTTLFNALTGLKQKVGNYPGITVEKKLGNAKLPNEIDAKIIDLPGTYSLFPKSMDEKVAQQILCNDENVDYPDVTVVIADATNLRRSIFLLTQVIDLNMSVVLALNMVDIATKKGIIVNVDLLSKELGVQVVAINARKRKGIESLRESIINAIDKKPLKPFLFVRKLFKDLIEKANKIRGKENDYASFLALCKQELGGEVVNRCALNQLCKALDIIPERVQAKETVKRYKAIDKIIYQTVKQGKPTGKYQLTKNIDDVLIHPILGYVVFLMILFLLFQSVFSWSAYPMEVIDSFFTNLSVWIANALPPGMLNDLLVNGILAGLGGIVIFVPQIAFLFAFIAFLEDTGYMARVSFITDKLLRNVGLNGRSIIPLLSGAACAVPAIMSARTISSWKERLITIMVTPLMSCSARLPVYTIIIGMIIPIEEFRGFNLQGLVLMAFYLLGFMAAIAIAFVMKFIIKSKERSYYIMEMPSYKMPDWKTVLYTIVEKVKIFLFDAGKIIIAISIVLWGLSSFAPGNKFEKIEEQWAGKADSEMHIAAEKLEVSYAGMIGKSIEPAIKPLGFDWKIGISLITSFAAREVFVGTMSTIYSVGDENIQSIQERMKNVKNQETGEAFFTPAVGISLMLFYAFAMQCMSTLAIVYRETKHWKWPVIQFFYMGALAYLSSFITYQLLS
ncbi:MAG: ferrous iron transport protein B [Flavobacteriales bacterium]|nr:ferrous iron transport protein B [Flavobacteriales bacterium]